MDGRTDRLIPVYPPPPKHSFCHGMIISKTVLKCNKTTHLTSFPTVILAITFFTASFFFSFLSLFNSAFSSKISPKIYKSLQFNSLPNNKILDWSKLKAFADNKVNLNEKLKLVLGRIENMGKGENAGNQKPSL